VLQTFKKVHIGMLIKFTCLMSMVAVFMASQKLSMK